MEFWSTVLLIRLFYSVLHCQDYFFIEHENRTTKIKEKDHKKKQNTKQLHKHSKRQSISLGTSVTIKQYYTSWRCTTWCSRRNSCSSCCRPRCRLYNETVRHRDIEMTENPRLFSGYLTLYRFSCILRVTVGNCWRCSQVTVHTRLHNKLCRRLASGNSANSIYLFWCIYASLASSSKITLSVIWISVATVFVELSNVITETYMLRVGEWMGLCSARMRIPIWTLPMTSPCWQNYSWFQF